MVHQCMLVFICLESIRSSITQNLFEKVIQRKVPICFMRQLTYWYVEQTMKIKWGKHLSEPFHVTNGIRQGEV